MSVLSHARVLGSHRYFGHTGKVGTQTDVTRRQSVFRGMYSTSWDFVTEHHPDAAAMAHAVGGEVALGPLQPRAAAFLRAQWWGLIQYI